MKQLFGLITCFCVLITGCISTSRKEVANWMQDNGKLKVLCTTEMVKALVEGVGQDFVDCIALIHGESDPHSYQIVKGDDEKLARADVVFFNGLGLEHGPSLAHFLENNPKAFSVGDYILHKTPEQILKIDHSWDPHIWMDISLFARAIPGILQVLQERLPGKRKELEAQAAHFTNTLMDAHNRVTDIMHELPLDKRYLVTTHDAFNYFTRAYLATPEEAVNGTWEVHCQAPEGLAPDSQLSTADIQRILAYVLRYNVHIIFAEANTNQDSIRKLVDAAAKMHHTLMIARSALYADSMGRQGTIEGTYVGMMEYDAWVIEEALR